MFRMLDQEEIQFNWEEYEGAISEAINASVGSKAMFDSDKKVLGHIYKKLTNPFNSSMQLWVVEEEGLNYVVLTQIQYCEFTGRKTLLWFSATKVGDVDTNDMVKAYQEGENGLKEYAKMNDCEGICGYTDLDYFAKKVKEDWDGAITRYFFYLPMKEAA
jgi:hypothetical protein|tara:strand:- start:336 stop:815 length:480 start_codon:yes stop_codon:yes gene_type:complete